MRDIDFFHLKLTSASMQEIIERVDLTLQSKRGKILISSVNAAMTVISRDDSLITNAINGSDIVNIDGMSVYYSLRLLGLKVPGRVAGPDIFYNLVELSARRGYRPYFLGARPEVLEAMANRFKSEFAGLEIAGYHHGYYKDDETESIIKMIDTSGADMVFLGISSPKRELFTNKYFSSSSAPVWKGVGGSFDIYANLTKRAPQWLQDIGMEWFYRLCQEPGRMWKRYLVTNIVFISMITGELIRKYSGGKRKVFWK
jgi:N-acetylglucosaminyldiphosphoundecaprenol N-acetyl-beta-D-mannosaminyltransferase